MTETRGKGRVQILIISSVLVLGGVCALFLLREMGKPALPFSTITPIVIHLDLPEESGRPGGLITVDLNSDGKRDFIVTKPGHIVASDSSGSLLWSKRIGIQLTGKSEDEGLPGLHCPGVQAADIDGDGEVEVLFLTKDGSLHSVKGPTGMDERAIKIPSPSGTARWEHLVIANFRGKGDRDLLLQATNLKGYRVGRYLAAYAFDELIAGEKRRPLWSRNDFMPNAHHGARIADLDRDGRDEVLGSTILGPAGEMLAKIDVSGHIDSIHADDVRPDIPGLEVVALEEGQKNRVFLYNHQSLIWQADYMQSEPQNTAIGEFDLSRPGLEIWARSRFARFQKPFVFDSNGNLIAAYEMDKVAPRWWTSKGVEVISPIHWTGGPKQLAAAKERHDSGDIAIFDPMTGRFLHRWKEAADRLYVADVVGDWREELIVLNGSQLHIYSNDSLNPNPDHPRLWTQDYYRRTKMTWNYYSP